jgi:hypothetical protein
VADAGHDRIALVGEAIALSATASWDPNAAPLTAAWTLTDAPDTSVAALTGPTDPEVAFTPDVAGRYTVTLEVDDGGGRATHVVTIDAVEALIVPDDADTLAEAVALASDGGAIALRAGTWTGGVDLDGKDLVLFGLGAPADTVIDAGWDGPVVEAARGERPLIAQLTLANGSAEQGAGIDAALSGVDLRDVVIRDCFATGSGGGLYAKSTSSLIDVAFVGNGAQTGGGFAIDGAATLVRVALTAGVATEAGGIAHGFERAGRGVRIDAAIDGLSDAEVYYVTRVDANTIRLSLGIAPETETTLCRHSCAAHHGSNTQVRAGTHRQRAK